jgi:hypothetical protein
MKLGRRTWLQVAIAFAIAVPFCLLIGPLIIGYLLLRGSLEQVAVAEHEIQQPAFYQQIAKDLALFCQSYGSAFEDANIRKIEKAWLPDSAQKLKH